ncbi:vomeronasal 1 receptor ornAnaV1R3241 [Ornithorhynchus anatinus]|uniref:Vomeronasal type-1 receptor n=1 Tax=Ornithorhynchus anatinus TaxID=9258 RepID=A0A6I8NN54_ORNAN|nr:vomeronasal 1 receptor ornAnaV1R3241 [Ornithorhynchus anatinus]
MDGTELSFRMATLLQISPGVSANVFLLLFCIRVVSASRNPSSPDLILGHPASANALILLTSGIPEVLSAWGWRNSLDAAGREVLLCFYRAARGLAICTTCLPSVFQAVTLGPGTSRWAGVRARPPKCILPLCLLSWVINMLVDVTAPIHMTGPQNGSSVRLILDLRCCSTVGAGPAATLAVAAVTSFRDLFLVGLVSAASGHMVSVPHRHRRRARHLRGPGRSPGATPEVGAAKGVVALVTLYVLLYGRQAITLSVSMNRREKSPPLVNGHTALSFAFSVVGPFPIIYGDGRMRTFRKRGSPESNPDPSWSPKEPALPSKSTELR